MDWFRRNCDLCSNYGFLGTQGKWEQNSQFLVNSEKLWCMSSGYKIKEHMESELSGIFQLKLVAKNGIWFLRDPFYVYRVKVTFPSMRQYNKTH